MKMLSCYIGSKMDSNFKHDKMQKTACLRNKEIVLSIITDREFNVSKFQALWLVGECLVQTVLFAALKSTQVKDLDSF